MRSVRGLLLGLACLPLGFALSTPSPTSEEPRALPGVTPAERIDFERGANAFRLDYGPFKGLGPVFNGNSCGECHQAGGLGGGAVDLLVGRTVRIGAIRGGKYSDLPELGGPTIQRRSLREIFADHPVAPEVVPSEAQFVSPRLTPPLFGDGLIEAIPDAAILAQAKRSKLDGVRGRVNRVRNPETGKLEIGRFGWKAQISTLHWFVCDANLNEMGVTTPTFPHEPLPQGKPYRPGEDATTDPEQHEKEIRPLVNFLRYLAPSGGVDSSEGRRRFMTIGCGECHVPTLTTGKQTSSALSEVSARLYSDLLLHPMGPVLADGIQQEQARGDEFRTPPLWGLAKRKFFLHDGRAVTVDAAIRSHGGEADPSRKRYEQLKKEERDSLLKFLEGI